MSTAIFRVLRPAQWSKNIFVLAPIVFAMQLGEPSTLVKALAAFAAFCIVASSIYVINDIMDRREDREHPRKRFRPIASGELPVGVAKVVFVVFAAAGGVLSWSLGSTFFILISTYLSINLLYAVWLKRVVILDVMAVASGYIFRVLGGAAAIDVAVSHWLLLCTTFLALLLILSKRRHELVLLAGDATEHRSVLGQYGAAFLDQMMNVVTASAVVSYALYSVDPETIARFGTNRLTYTIPPVLYGIFRFLYLVYQRSEERNPTEAILRDVPFLANIAVWALLVIWVIYFPDLGLFQ